MRPNGARVLIVDDEAPIRRFLRASLSAHGYVVFEADTGQGALSGVIAHRPDVVILDLGLPDMDGVEVTRLLRKWTQVPIVVLSVRDREEEKIAALDSGADDYVTKPFGMGELLARLRVAARHAAGLATEPVFCAEGLKVDLARRLVTVGDREVQLTPTEYDLLKALVNHAGKVLTHKHLLSEVWGEGYEQEKHLLRVNISNLRRKIEEDVARPRYIQSEPGVGYRLRASP
ncbi:MAG: response regulator [Chloroflexi bacterium]|nr:response regulator [Chloroflexota bacterium]